MSIVHLEAEIELNIYNKPHISFVSDSLVYNGLKNFISDFNVRNKGAEKYLGIPQVLCGVKVLIIFHNLLDVIKCDRSNSYKYSQEKLKYEVDKVVIAKLPIIHITLIDLLSDEVSEDERKIQQLCPRYVSVIDSSSWNYYAPVKIDKSTGNFDFERLEIVINKIINNYNIEDKGSIYDLVIPNEYADLNARLLEQSYLEGNGHGNNVSPLLFHSEWKMREKSLDLLNVYLREYVKNCNMKWRILFLDDHCTDNMKPFNEKKPTKITKRDILNTRLREISKLLNLDSIDKIFDIHIAKTLTEAEELLKVLKFDIVILDYLLGDSSKGREYGYELLDTIKKNKERTENIIKNKGPYGKYWFIFSSGFTQAVGERLLAEGISHSEENWYIGRTSCPTNTPELFVYNFLSLMNRQLETIGITYLDKKDNSITATTLVDLLLYIYEDDRYARTRAIDNFNNMLRFRAHYDTLKKDYYLGDKSKKESKEKGSPLVQSLFPDMEVYNNAFWEHVQHLIYLVAYGNIRQWSEMWDEYIFIKDILVDAEKVCMKNKDISQNKQLPICTSIEKYIYGIKRANH